MSKHLYNSLIFSKFAYTEAFSVQRSAFSVQRSAFSVQLYINFFIGKRHSSFFWKFSRRRRSAFLSLFVLFTYFYRVLHTMPQNKGIVRSALLCPIVTKFILYKNRNTPKLNGFGGLRFFFFLFFHNFNLFVYRYCSKP